VPQERRAFLARSLNRRHGRTIVFPLRHADDFLFLVGVAPGPGQDERAKQAAQEEMAAVAALLKQELGLELSATKTLVTPVTQPVPATACAICSVT